jgi:hypothetical protein
MDIHSLQRLIRTRGHQQLLRDTACPDEQDIAAFFDCVLEGEQLAQIVDHLAECEACTAQLALLSRMQREDAIRSTPELSLAKARRLNSPGKSSVKRYSGWVAAAVVVLALSVTFTIRDDPGPMMETRNGTESLPRTTRLRSSMPSAPTIEFPSAGQVVDLENHEFSWTAIPGTLFYDIHIVTAVGDLVIRERVNGMTWQFPDVPELAPGAEYYVRIEAYLADAKTVSSEHVVFTTEMLR